MTRFSRLAPLAALLACAIIASGCANTVRGAGKDIKATANAVKDSVE
ncbi:MAG: EncA/B family entericidin [Rhizobiaceae bacterium]|nr:EncA/B family entericidin [Rhizobiaceae bacterium]